MKIGGIGGRSAAGKSTLAHRVAERVPGAAILSLDDFFRADREYGPFTAPDAGGQRHFDLNHPDAVDLPHVLREVEAHRQMGAALLIVEGIFALAFAAVRERCMLTVFMAAPEDVRLDRKVARNLAQRGVAPEVTRRNHTNCG